MTVANFYRILGALALSAAVAAAAQITGQNLSSNGSLGDMVSLILTQANNGQGTSFVLNADCSIYDSHGTLQSFTPQVVSQSGGPSIEVLNFSNFGVPAGLTLTVTGSDPVAILSTTDVTIAGSLIVQAGGGAGGYSY